VPVPIVQNVQPVVLESTPKTTEPEIDENILCYITGENYTEDILGYGITVIDAGTLNVNLSTPAELLSKTAFDDGTRHSTMKIPFNYFIPAFINQKHAWKDENWVECLKTSILKIGKLFHT